MCISHLGVRVISVCDTLSMVVSLLLRIIDLVKTVIAFLFLQTTSTVRESIPLGRFVCYLFGGVQPFDKLKRELLLRTEMRG